jgi:hypothetical protein
VVVRTHARAAASGRSRAERTSSLDGRVGGGGGSCRCAESQARYALTDEARAAADASCS